MTTHAQRPDLPAPGRPVRVLTWLVRIALAAIFLGAGMAKLSGEPAMVDMFATIGAGQWLRHVVGACEVAGAAGVLIPWLSAMAAAGLALLMVGGTAANVTILDTSPALTLTILLLAVLALWLGLGRPGRRPRRRRPSPADPGSGAVRGRF